MKNPNFKEGICELARAYFVIKEDNRSNHNKKCLIARSLLDQIWLI